MLLPMVLALWFFLKAQKDKSALSYFLSGVLSGLAFMIKQVSIFNFLALLIFSFFLPAVWMLVGFAVVPALAALYFFFHGALVDLINCVFFVNQTYLAASPAPNFFLDPRFGIFMILGIINENGLIWILSLISFILMIFSDRKQENLVLLVWAFFSFLGLAAGKLFFGHYFIQLIPAFSLLSAYTIIKIKGAKNLIIKILFLLLLIIIAWSNFKYQLPFYTQYNPYQIVEAQHGTKSFGIACFASLALKPKISSQDEIFVWAAEPEVYYYLNHKSISRYPYYFIWMEKLKAKDTIIKDFRFKRPKYFLLTEYSPHFPELEKLIRTDYTLKERYLSWRLFERKK
jgi:4-amino-4-deoxy-L-arabinose transferase-like glycosyltransferase